MPVPSYPTLRQGWSDKQFPGSLIRLGNLRLTTSSYFSAQLRPPKSLHQSSIASSDSFPLQQAQSPLVLHSHMKPSTAWKAKMRQNREALKGRPSANFHLLCHLASFSPGHAESVFVGLDFSIRSGQPAMGGGRCLRREWLDK